MGVLIISAVLSTGCVKLNLQPERSIEAGKNIYNEAKLKRQGGERLEVSSQEAVADHSSREVAETSCLAGLKNRIAAQSTSREAVIVSEKIEILSGDSESKIQCVMVGFVWRGE